MKSKMKLVRKEPISPSAFRAADAVRHLTKVDSKIGSVIRKVGAYSLKKNRGGFDRLVRIVIGQQLSMKAADTIYKRVCVLCDGRTISQDKMKRLADGKLREAGMSRAKLIAVRDLIEKIEGRQVDVDSLPRLSDKEIEIQLTQVKGMGVWTAQMYLMFVLNRPDVFPSNDLGIRTAMTRIYGTNGDHADLERIADKWRPYRTVASWYLWQSLNLVDESKPTAKKSR